MESKRFKLRIFLYESDDFNAFEQIGFLPLGAIGCIL